MKDVQFIIDRVKKLAKEENISINKLLSNCQLNSNFITNLQRRGTIPSVESIAKIAKYFDVSIEWLIGDDDLSSVHTDPVMAVPKKIPNEFRGKALDSGLWVYGAYIYTGSTEKAYIQQYNNDGTLPVPAEIDPKTAGRYTQGYDMTGNEIYEDDLITGSNGVVMVIRYGEYKAYCPADRAFMRSVGFYAEAPGYPDMPIGQTNKYATKIGNLHDNPEIWAGCQEDF